jgi:hypothetical protein
MTLVSLKVKFVHGGCPPDLPKLQLNKVYQCSTCGTIIKVQDLKYRTLVPAVVAHYQWLCPTDNIPIACSRLGIISAKAEIIKKEPPSPPARCGYDIPIPPIGGSLFCPNPACRTKLYVVPYFLRPTPPGLALAPPLLPTPSRCPVCNKVVGCVKKYPARRLAVKKITPPEPKLPKPPEPPVIPEPPKPPVFCPVCPPVTPPERPKPPVPPERPKPPVPPEVKPPEVKPPKKPFPWWLLIIGGLAIMRKPPEEERIYL